MKAAIVKELGAIPVFDQFDSPVATDAHVLVNVSAAALSKLSKFRSMGMHYSSEINFPIIAGADGVGTLEDGSRVYFALPTAPYGSLAEQTIVNEKMIIRLPDGIDDVTAAAIANPAMSSWAALVYRARFRPGQTVLINGATGASGSLAVQIAKYLGAKKIIVTGRNESKLRLLEADEVVSFDMTVDGGVKAFQDALNSVISGGVDVILDYLWGDSAFAILSAIAQIGANQTTRFVSIGTSSGQETISVPSSILRASSIELLGSGGRSVSQADMLSSAKSVFEMAAEGKIKIAVAEFALKDIEAAWTAPLTPRPVIKV
ncbi:zinc-binding alcohol dehydrogenase family protein [Paenibacillus sp. NEAU-GSW1]|uniref:quinone oxidoreductase family protein n=1 Tax=Paenibacillus sp. NEAU-GSW1 TaxID=2682486 RepID=UPI0012E15F4E|nr:zinc-binding alcohol dehydrogenase family protein [Paenibacillus sp. NEAU-GSW1]MUT65800.1 zinc-binding dehydrogenase [Paenibacillus sp. NEAU-GSW1]